MTTATDLSATCGDCRFAVDDFCRAIFAAIVIVALLLASGSAFGWKTLCGEFPKAKTDKFTPCEHEDEMRIFQPRSADGCEECVKNNYKWVHLRLCLGCGHVGCCDSSKHQHATKHFHAKIIRLSPRSNRTKTGLGATRMKDLSAFGAN